jgi:outer membrane protein insertion porin family
MLPRKSTRGKASGRVHDLRRSGQARLCPATQHHRQHQDARRGRAPRNPPDGKRWYDADKITASKQRLDRLGYFTEVAIETPAVAGTSDQLDVNVNVAERPTGNLMLGLGTSSTDKIILSGSISQSNFMGSGNNVTMQVNSARSYRTYVFSYTNPYFTQDGVTRASTSTTDGQHAVDVDRLLQIGLDRRGDPLRLPDRREGIHRRRPRSRFDEDHRLREQPAQVPGVRRLDSGEASLTKLSLPLTTSWSSDGRDSFFFRPREPTRKPASKSRCGRRPEVLSRPITSCSTISR